jgi:ADP-heptose:LPS heptosyltransferase
MDYRGASLPETAYLLEVATRIIVVEGGIAHLTAATSALGRSVTVIYGPTSPVLFRYPGFFQASRTICPPCWQASPLWALGRCALGEPTCVNFPAADRVEALAVDDPNGVLVRAH